MFVEPDTHPDAALDLMDELRIRHLPVLDSGQLVGVVSDRDLLAATGRPILGGESAGTLKANVSDWMKTDPVVVSRDESVVAAAVEVIVRGIGCLPVIDDKKLVGIVTEMDLLRVYVSVCAERELSGPQDPPVASLATREALVVAPSDRWKDVQALGTTESIRHFPVVLDGDLRGMLSDRDLRRAQGAQLDPDTAVETLMIRPVQTVNSTVALSVAAKLMLEFKITALPVRFDDGLGIVSAPDILDHSTSVLR